MEFEQARFLVPGANWRPLSRAPLNKPGSITGNRTPETFTKRSRSVHAHRGDRTSLKRFFTGSDDDFKLPGEDPFNGHKALI
jgi:hypothetical protein